MALWRPESGTCPSAVVRSVELHAVLFSNCSSVLVRVSVMHVLRPSCSGANRCLDAFTIALSQACEGGEKRWYTSTLGLQLASLEFCKVCRSVPTLDALVVGGTPRSLWSPPKAHTGHSTTRSKVCVSSRGPVVRALRVTWALPMGVLLEDAAVELWSLSELLRVQGAVSAGSLSTVVWPKGLKHLELDTFGEEITLEASTSPSTELSGRSPCNNYRSGEC